MEWEHGFCLLLSLCTRVRGRRFINMWGEDTLSFTKNQVKRKHKYNLGVYATDNKNNNWA